MNKILFFTVFRIQIDEAESRQSKTIRGQTIVVNRLVKNSQARYPLAAGLFQYAGFSFTFKINLLYIKPLVEPQWFIAQNTGEHL
jgi:hypothetical protein